MYDPNNSQVLYSGGYVYYNSTYCMTVSKTTDGGTSWTRDTLATTYSMTYALAVDPTNSNNVYAGGQPGIYRTTDGGNIWSLVSTGLSGTVYDIKFDPSNTAIMYAATSSNVYKSVNSGVNWSSCGCAAANAVLVNPGNVNEIYAGTNSGVYKSTNAGSSWAQMNTGLYNTTVTSLGIYPDNYLYAGTDGGGMYRWNIMVGVAEQKCIVASARLRIHPNPASGSVQFSYVLNISGPVKLAVYDALGRKIASMVDADQSTGKYTCHWDCRDRSGDHVVPGIYFCRFETVDAVSIQKLVMVK